MPHVGGEHDKIACWLSSSPNSHPKGNNTVTHTHISYIISHLLHAEHDEHVASFSCPCVLGSGSRKLMPESVLQDLLAQGFKDSKIVRLTGIQHLHYPLVN